MKIGLHVELSDAANNIEITLQHTGVVYPTKTIIHRVEIEVPDPPKGFEIDRITISEDSAHAKGGGE